MISIEEFNKIDFNSEILRMIEFIKETDVSNTFKTKLRYKKGKYKICLKITHL